MGSGAYVHCNKCVAQGKLKDVCVPSSAGAPRVENSSKSRQDFLAAPGYGAGRKGRRPTGGMVLKHRCVSKDTEKWGKGTYGQLADRGTREELVPAVASCNRKKVFSKAAVGRLSLYLRFNRGNHARQTHTLPLSYSANLNLCQTLTLV